MSDDDFLEQMAGVEPLRREPRARLRKGSAPVDPDPLRAAAEGSEASVNPLPDDGVEPLDAWYVLDFKRPGIQHGVYRKLRLGRYEIDARLDLHRMTVKQARREVHEFVREAGELGLRTLLILHGKGQRAPDQARSAVLKGYVNHWLKDLDPVQAFHSAQPQHGGTGAVYVLLRKGEAAKQRNRERFMKGRVPYEGR